MNQSPGGHSQSLTTIEIQALLKRGFDALNAKRFDEAGECCQRILSVAPKTIEAHFLVGLIATETKESRIAIQAFGSVTTLDPSHAAGWAHLARHFIKIGQPKRADNAVESAIKAGTEDPIRPYCSERFRLPKLRPADNAVSMPFPLKPRIRNVDVGCSSLSCGTISLLRPFTFLGLCERITWHG